ncbi:MAG: hypothetical protein AAFY26_11255 [Cyanobacteria bacterium J06638_22]
MKVGKGVFWLRAIASPQTRFPRCVLNLTMPSSGRFQSRVFSEINRQRLQWGDRMGRGWRYSRMSLIWATQILLYPIYAGFQTLRLVGRQLAQAPQRLKQAGNILRRAVGLETPPPTPALNASTPIQHTLQAVEALGIALPSGAAITTLSGSNALVKEEPPSSLAPVALQGIASDRETGHLVLVADHNHILDVLTDAQQQMLRQRIVMELAQFWRDRQRTLAEAQPVLPLPPLRPSPRMLPPVRWFYRLMQWEQQSEIALATNLFQETALIVYSNPRQNVPAGHEQAVLDWDGLKTIADPTPLTGVPQLYQLAQGTMRSQLAALGTETALRPIPADVSSDDPVVAIAPASPDQTVHAAASSEIEQRSSNALETQSPSGLSNSTAMEPYVETSAQLVEYVKHPLEHVLEWLDKGMAWLEDQILILRHWWNKFRD